MSRKPSPSEHYASYRFDHFIQQFRMCSEKDWNGVAMPDSDLVEVQWATSMDNIENRKKDIVAIDSPPLRENCEASAAPKDAQNSSTPSSEDKTPSGDKPRPSVLLRKFRAKEGAPFARTCDALAFVQHPYVCSLQSSFVDAKGNLYIASPAYSAETLRSWLRWHGASIDCVLRVGAQLMDAVCALHLQGIVHGDLNADAVLMSSSHSTATPRIFGVLGVRSSSQILSDLVSRATAKLLLHTNEKPRVAPEVERWMRGADPPSTPLSSRCLRSGLPASCGTQSGVGAI